MDPYNADGGKHISNTAAVASGRYTVFASMTGAKLDSHVITGSGTDDTEILQSILNKAPEWGNLHLVLDGAALVSGLDVYSNTTIECLNQSCGLFQAPQSNRALLRNAHPDHQARHDKNITLIGGIYNQDCRNQLHHLTGEDGSEILVMGMQFYGIENLTLRDVTIRNQRTFALTISNFFRVNLDNVAIDLPDHIDFSNQDGLHFWGPGQFLKINNVQGRSGDDFIALAPDEIQPDVDITDVHIDGVFLDHADQGIRLLSRGNGRLDRVVIRNVTGTYRSFGFYLNPWFLGSGGNYGNIVVENVNLHQVKPNYDYTPPFLFRIGGKIESLSLRNIHHHNPTDNRSIAQIGWTFHSEKPLLEGIPVESHTRIGTLVLDGVQIYENGDQSADASYIEVMCPIDQMTVRDVIINRTDEVPQKGCFIKTEEGAKIGTLMIYDVSVRRMENLILVDQGNIKTLQLNNILCEDMGEGLIKIVDGTINILNTHGIETLSSLKKAGKAEPIAPRS